MMTSATNNDVGEAGVKELSGSGHEDTKVVSTDSGDRVVNDNDDEYIQSSAATCPPLVKLQFYGMCCPFIESEEGEFTYLLRKVSALLCHTLYLQSEKQLIYNNA